MGHDDANPNVHISIHETIFPPLCSKDSRALLTEKENRSACAGNKEQWHKHNREAKNKGMFPCRTGGHTRGEGGGGNITMMQNGILGKKEAMNLRLIQTDTTR